MVDHLPIQESSVSQDTATEDDSQRSIGSLLARGAAGAFLVRVCGIGILFFLHLLLANVLKDQYGIYAYVISWVAVLGIVSVLGMDILAVRYVSEFRTHKQWGLLRGLLQVVFGGAFLTSLLVGVGMAVLAGFWPAPLSPQLRYSLIIAGIVIIPLVAFLDVTRGVMQGLLHVTWAFLPRTFFSPLFLIVVIVGLFYFGIPLSASWVLGVQAISFGFALAISLLNLRHFLRQETIQASPERKTKEWLCISIPMLFVSGFVIINTRMDILMLGAFQDTTQVGIYSVAVQVSQLAHFVHVAICSMVAPLISSLYSQNRREALQRLLAWATLGGVVFTVPLSLVMLIFGRSILGMFGSSFVDGYEALLILIVGRCLCTLSGTTGQLLQMTGHQKNALYIFGVSLLINFLLNALLIPSWGMIGAAVATMISAIIREICMLAIIFGRLKLDPTIGSVRVLWRR